MYILIVSGKPVVYSIDQLFKDNPYTSFPNDISEELLNSYGVFPCYRPPFPKFDDTTYKIVDDDFVQDDSGKWTLGYKLERLSVDEASKNVRDKRNQLLIECDWTQLADSKADKESWAVYRQALRDITLQTGFPWNVEWPTQP